MHKTAFGNGGRFVHLDTILIYKYDHCFAESLCILAALFFQCSNRYFK
jgi:hypothetical protein